MINASIDLYETTFEIKYLKRAIELNDILVDEFWDNPNGGFYFTSSNSEKLIARQKEVYDGAIPSGNSIALLNFVRLARLTSNVQFENKAKELVKHFSGHISKTPSMFSMFMCGFDFLFSSSTEIAVIATSIDDETIKGLNLIRSIYNPNKVLILKTDNSEKDFNKLFPFTIDMKMKGNITTYFVCRNYSCNQPVNSVNDLEKLLFTQ